MSFNVDKFVQEVTKALCNDNSMLPTFNCSYAFAVVNNLGILHLITGNKKIYRKQHLRPIMDSTQMTLPLFNELLPSMSMFKALLLVGDKASIDFAYCYQLTECMDRPEAGAIMTFESEYIIRPVFVAYPLSLWYGEFAEAILFKYSDSTVHLGGNIRTNRDMANSFEIKPIDIIHIRSAFALRITGSRRYLHVTKKMFDNNQIEFVTPSNIRKKHFNSWLQVQSYLHGHSKPDLEEDYPVIINPLVEIPYE